MSDDLLDVDVGLGELTSLLLDNETLASTLERVAVVANRCVTGGNGVSITLVKRGSPYTAYATDNRVRAVDEHQYERRLGPCLAALTSGELQVSCDGDGGHGWAELRHFAAALGVHSFLSAPLIVRGEPAGTLNVYSDRTDAFGGEEVAAAVLLAAQAAISVANAAAHEECLRRVAQLQEALDTRVVIEQAKGVLMERERVGPDAAFGRLRAASQDTNTKLRQVAAEVVATAGRRD